MKVLVSGAGGLIGSALTRSLGDRGHEVARLTRFESVEGPDIPWDPAEGVLDLDHGYAVDAVVHLAGENIAAGRWTAERKARIRDSRTSGTTLLANRLAGLQIPPRAFVTASAIGFYGDRADEVLTEDSPPGTGFLAETCVEWEAAARPVLEAGVRLAHIRIGVVLSRDGGALGKMRLPFLLGLGGVTGSGNQYMSCISIQDLVRVFAHAIESDVVNGPVNAVGPVPVTNRQFTKALGRVLNRPTIFPLPAFAARLLVGEMADALLLSSARVLPERLKEMGFQFDHPDLETALRAALCPQA